jgi:hypothetical protein
VARARSSSIFSEQAALCYLFVCLQGFDLWQEGADPGRLAAVPAGQAREGPRRRRVCVSGECVAGRHGAGRRARFRSTWEGRCRTSWTGAASMTGDGRRAAPAGNPSRGRRRCGALGDGRRSSVRQPAWPPPLRLATALGLPHAVLCHQWWRLPGAGRWGEESVPRSLE